MARMRRRELPGASNWRRWRLGGAAPAAPHALDWAVSWVRWALLTVSFLFALLSPPLGQFDQRTVSLALLLVYNALVELLRRRLPLLRGFAWVPLVDLALAALIYALGTQPFGPRFLAFYVGVATAAMTLSLARSLLYTVGVGAVVAALAPTLPGWALSPAPWEQLGTRLIVLALVGGGGAYLMRRLVAEQEATRAGEARLRLLTGQIPAYGWATDRDLRVTSTFGTGLAELGVGPGAYVGKTLDELRGPEAPATLAHRRALAGEPAEYETTLAGRTLEARVEPLRDATGRVVGCLGLALDVTGRRREERRRAVQHEVSRVLAEAADLAGAAPRVLQAIGQGLEWDYGALWIVDGRDHVLRCADTWHTAGAEFAAFVAASRATGFPPGTGLPGRTWSGGQPLWISDTAGEPSFVRLQAAVAEGLRAGVGLPLRLDGQVVGVLEFLGREVRAPEPDTLELLAALGGQIGQFVERKRAEAALRESEARKGAILGSALDAIITMDREGTVVEFNPAAERTFGYAAAEAVGRELAELIVPPALRERHRQGLARCLATGEGPVLDRRVELQGMRADGAEFPVELTVARIAAGDAPLFTGFVRDISERRRAEEALAARARQQATVAELGRVALATPDLSRVLDEAVAAVARTLAVEYCKVLELLPGGDVLLLRAGVGWRAGTVGRATVPADRDSQAGYTLLTDRPVLVADLRAETRFSGPSLLHEHGVVSGLSAVIGGTSRPFGVLGAHTRERRAFTPDDAHFLQAVANVLATAIRRQAVEHRLVEERAAAAAERAEAARLAELDRLRNEFVAAVSHDLRTPLTAARLATAALQGPTTWPESAARELLGVVGRSLDRLRLYIDNLLTVNQLDAGALRPRREHLDLRAVVAEAVAVVRPLVEEAGQTLEVDLPEPLPVVGDAELLERVLVNLLVNAHHHTPAGTRIAVAGRRAGDEVCLDVSDDGPGIPAEELGRVFERHHRLAGDRRGYGLGLAIVRHLVEAHGGRAWAESAPERGATFRVALPADGPTRDEEPANLVGDAVHRG